MAECKWITAIITRAGMFFNAYTFVRPNELRRAEWEEIDIKKREWVIPAEKMRREHVVPLSRQDYQILEDIKPFTGRSKYISLRSEILINL